MRSAQDGSVWKAQPERSSAFSLRLIAWIAIHIGRSFAHILLWPVALFFVLTGRAARLASYDYLRRVLGRAPWPVEVLRHFHNFAVCTLDRVLIICGRDDLLNVQGEQPADVQQAVKNGTGCLILVSHLGSFEVLRQLAHGGLNPSLRILLDRGQGPLLTSWLERLNPHFAASIIDAGKRGPELVLALREVLAQGCSIGIMADRMHNGEPTLEVQLLNAPVRLPAAPWVLASVLQVPVIAVFAVYRGGRDYEASFELLTSGISATRAERQAVIQEWAQRYALRVEQQVRAAPYNWFNFYPYWNDDRTGA